MNIGIWNNVLFKVDLKYRISYAVKKTYNMSHSRKLYDPYYMGQRFLQFSESPKRMKNFLNPIRRTPLRLSVEWLR